MASVSNNNVLQDTLIEAVRQTFEEMAFTDTLYETSPPQEIKYENHLKIDFLEPVKARLIFCFSDAFKNSIAENILGQDSANLTENDLDDSLLELLNILAGKFLTLFYGKETLHKVDFPEMIVDLNERDKKGLIDLYFKADEAIFEIKLIEGI